MPQKTTAGPFLRRGGRGDSAMSAWSPVADARFTRRDRLFLGLLTALSLVLGLGAISRFGYAGQDFVMPRALILLFQQEPLAHRFRYTAAPLSPACSSSGS
jgi:hypothetical protein